MIPNVISLNPGDSLDTALDRVRSKPGVTFDLAPGVYETEGVLFMGQWAQLQEGWRIRGSGKGRTILKLARAQDGFGCVFSNWYYGKPNIEISDLTIDCNYPELSKKFGPDLELVGVRLYGDRATVRRVEVINAAGLRKGTDGNNLECFPLSIGAWEKSADNCLIEECDVHHVANPDGLGYVSAIAIQGDPGHLTMASGTIRNCVIRLNGAPTEFGLNLANSTNLVFEGNTVTNAARCFGNDTGINTGVWLRNNRFRPAKGGVGMFVQRSRESIAERNWFDLENPGSAGIAFCNDGSVSDWIIQHNHFTGAPQARHIIEQWIPSAKKVPRLKIIR